MHCCLALSLFYEPGASKVDSVKEPAVLPTACSGLTACCCLSAASGSCGLGMMDFYVLVSFCVSQRWRSWSKVMGGSRSMLAIDLA
jgi:hypothetical protein